MKRRIKRKLPINIRNPFLFENYFKRKSKRRKSNIKKRRRRRTRK